MFNFNLAMGVAQHLLRSKEHTFMNGNNALCYRNSQFLHIRVVGGVYGETLGAWDTEMAFVDWLAHQTPSSLPNDLQPLSKAALAAAAFPTAPTITVNILEASDLYPVFDPSLVDLKTKKSPQKPKEDDKKKGSTKKPGTTRASAVDEIQLTTSATFNTFYQGIGSNSLFSKIRGSYCSGLPSVSNR